MTIRIRPISQLHCSVHESPSLAGRIFGRTERDYEAKHTRDLGGRSVWVTHDNRPVSARVAAEIERQMGGGQ